MFRGLRASGFTASKRHLTGPAMIDVHHDRATALSYWWVADYATDKTAVYATGTYADDLQKIDGQWKITRRVQTIDSASTV
jgi:SnoaL-like domain